MAKIKSIREDESSKIQALLNDSQKQKFAQDQQRRQERMQEHSAAPAGGPAADNNQPLHRRVGLAGDQCTSRQQIENGIHSLPSDCATAL